VNYQFTVALNELPQRQQLIVHDMAPFAFWLSDAQQNIRCCANPYKQ
jgi:hypothetical protein